MVSAQDLPHHRESITIARPPEVVYAMVSDVTRMGEWSPICTGCRWDEDQGDAPAVGAWFTGRNETPEHVWETRCRVAVADPGREFVFVVGADADKVRWGYTCAVVPGGTELTESWEILPEWVKGWADKKSGAELEEFVAERESSARTSLSVTLAAIKMAAEAHS